MAYFKRIAACAAAFSFMAMPAGNARDISTQPPRPGIPLVPLMYDFKPDTNTIEHILELDETAEHDDGIYSGKNFVPYVCKTDTQANTKNQFLSHVFIAYNKTAADTDNISKDDRIKAFTLVSDEVVRILMIIASRYAPDQRSLLNGSMRMQELMDAYTSGIQDALNIKIQATLRDPVISSTECIPPVSIEDFYREQRTFEEKYNPWIKQPLPMPTVGSIAPT